MTKDALRLFLENYQKQLWAETEKLLASPMPELSEELFSLFERTGDRLQYENVYFTRRKFLTLLGIRAVWERKRQNVVDPRLLDKLADVIRDVCNEPCWALPAHVNRKLPGWQKTVDLFASETAQTLAELADGLRDALPGNVLRLITDNVENRVLLPFLTSPGQSWEKANHNWNAVCAGAIGSVCLHLMRERKDILLSCLKRVTDSLPYYVDGFSADGVCMEGLGYFTYGMAYFVHFAQELWEYTNGKEDLLCDSWAGFSEGGQDKRARIAGFYSTCYFADGRTVNFSDASDSEKYCIGLACALNRRFPLARIPDVRQASGPLDDTCYRFVFRKMDLMETEKYLERMQETETPAEAAACRFLPDAQWCVANARNEVGFACKGGHNGEPHNHNDVGHFIYESAGQILLADLGAGEYTADYFGKGRYDILCNRSLGHSVPIIGGQEQKPGAAYGCGEFRLEEAPGLYRVRMEISGAYEKGLLTRLDRQFSFSLADGTLQAEDMFLLPEGNANDVPTIEENLITQVPPKVLDNGIVLDGGGVRAVLTIDGIRPAEDVTILEFSHSNHAGKAEKVYAIRWKVKMQGQTGIARFTVEKNETASIK